MSYPRRAVILPMPRKYVAVMPINSYAGTRIDASVVPGTIVHSMGPGNISYRGITGRPSGTILGGQSVMRPATGGRTIVPTIIPTPAVLRNPTIGPPAHVQRSQAVVPGPRQPVANHRRHARGPPVPPGLDMPVGRAHRGYPHGLPPRRR